MGDKRPKFRFWCAVAAAATLSLALVTGAYEIYLRQRGFLASLPPAYPCVTPHPTLNHVLRPQCEERTNAETLRVPVSTWVAVNAEGWRGADWRPPNQRKILMFGDSYTEGFGVENWRSLPAQTEAALASRGYDWQVYNAGVMGYANALYPRIWKERFSARGAEIDYVLVNLDFSDFNENLYYTSIAAGDAQNTHFPATEIFPRWFLALVYSNKLAVLRLLHQEINGWKVKRLARANEWRVHELLKGEARIPKVSLKRWGLEACWPSLEVTARYLERLREALPGHIRMGVHMYPTGAQVRAYPKRAFAVSFVEKLDLGATGRLKCSMSLRVADIMHAFAREKGWDFFDSRPVILNHPKREGLYFPDDAHWNESGVATAAEALAKAMETRLKRR